MIASGAVRREKRKLIVVDRPALAKICSRYTPPKAACNKQPQLAGWL
jgi:hypothetical protein